MLSIIIPTLNEEEGIAKTICSIPDDIRKDAELINVDVSGDMTPVIAKKLGATVLRPGKKGKGWQMRYAVEHSTGDVLLFMDGDGAHPGGHIPQMLEKLKDADLVLGCPSGEKLPEDDVPLMGRIFRYNSMIAMPLAHMLGMNVADPFAGFRAIRRRDWEKLALKSDNFEIEMEMNINALKQHFRIAEVRIPSLKRCGGVLSSKFFASPKMWLRVYNMAQKYQQQSQKTNG